MLLLEVGLFSGTKPSADVEKQLREFHSVKRVRLPVLGRAAAASVGCVGCGIASAWQRRRVFGQRRREVPSRQRKSSLLWAFVEGT